MSKILMDEMPTQPFDCPFAAPDIETSNYLCGLAKQLQPSYCELKRVRHLEINYECPYLRALSDYEDEF